MFGKHWIAFPRIPTDNKILFFSRDQVDFGFLSNFYLCDLHIDQHYWPHVEAYYQAQKSENSQFQDEILKKENPSWSKYVGDSRIGDRRLSKKSWFRKHPEDLRPDWAQIKIEVMKKALNAKFTQNINLQLALLNTLPAELVEDSENDSFWGTGKENDGKNILGNLLMDIRSGIKKNLEI